MGKRARDREEESGSAEKVLIQADVDDGYDRLLAGRSRFIHWYKRLERDLAEPDFSFALAILGSLAKSDEGLTRKQLLCLLAASRTRPYERAAALNRLLLKLEEDGYVDGSGERILFLSFPLRAITGGATMPEAGPRPPARHRQIQSAPVGRR